METIRWLREVADCPWDTMALSRVTLQRRNLGLLDYMQAQGVQYTANELTALLAHAGCDDVTKVHFFVRAENASQRTTVEQGITWLRNKGAEWPAMLAWHRETDGQMVPWVQLEVIDWARQHGCTAPLPQEAT